MGYLIEKTDHLSPPKSPVWQCGGTFNLQFDFCKKQSKKKYEFIFSRNRRSHK